MPLELKKMEPLWGCWRITNYLGSGACGEVWELRSGDRVCAMKHIAVEMGQEEQEQARWEGLDTDGLRVYLEGMFEDAFCEYSAMNALRSSRYTVHAWDVLRLDTREAGTLGWHLLIRMEKLQPLRDRLGRGTPPVRELVRMASDVCRALEDCQTLGILHRDMAPKNIFYDPTQSVYKLGDFGLARQLGEPITMPEKPGTYAAPEVFSESRYSFGSDLYALGVILYRLLNGNRLPFLPPAPIPYTPAQRSEALLRRYLGERPQNQTLENWKGTEQELARSVSSVALRAMEPEPKARFQSAREMRQVLEALLKEFTPQTEH